MDNHTTGEPRRKFWGWGYEGQGLEEPEQAEVAKRTAEKYGVDSLEPAAPPPAVSEITLRHPRLEPPSSLQGICSSEPYERLLHSYGRSFPDAVRIFQRDFPEPPDVVAYPEHDDHVRDLLDWAGTVGAAAIPFGGGTSVCGGVEPAVGDRYKGTVSIDMARMDKVVEVDRIGRAARIQGGARGPVFEAGLREHGLTLRHYPQSFEMATLGGMIATRSGGHFASNYTHIDDFVESIRMVTPSGILETRRLPGSGAGPSPDRMMIGSEGILGLITEAWVRLQDRPRFRASAPVHFATFAEAAEAVRALSQSGLFPSNCRLIDAQEAANTGAGDGTQHLLVLAFESGDHPLDAWMARALELVRDHGGVPNEAPSAAEGSAHRSGAAGSWRDAFLKAPYYREVLVPLGVISDTFETAIPWRDFGGFHEKMMAGTRAAIEEVTGREASVTCRFTHVYPMGRLRTTPSRASGPASSRRSRSGERSRLPSTTSSSRAGAR